MAKPYLLSHIASFLNTFGRQNISILKIFLQKKRQPIQVYLYWRKQFYAYLFDQK